MISLDVVDLEATVAVQAAIIAELRAVNAAQAQAIAALKARAAELERRLGTDSSNSSKPPSSDDLRSPRGPSSAAPSWPVRWWSGSRPGRCSTCHAAAVGARAPRPATQERLWDHDPGRLPPPRLVPWPAMGRGCGRFAATCYLCVHQHLPVDRAAQLLGDVLGARLATRTLAGAQAFLTVRSYGSTARKHQVNPLRALHQLFQGCPWLPAPAGP
jgi:uncharacterized coiled-coil protein SlyX